MKISLLQLLSLAIALIFAGPVARSQSWDTYLARYDNGLGSVQLNMDLVRSSSRTTLPFLVITGVTYHDRTGDGFPTHREFKKLYRLTRDINRLILKETQPGAQTKSDPLKSSWSVHAGTFTFQGQRLDYIYVVDTVGLREKLKRCYTKKYPRYDYQIQLTHDPEWDAYTSFLYPNEEVRTFMMNERAITRLNDAGDVLSRPRFVEHRIYFDTREDREYFIRYIGRVNYDIKDEREIKGDRLRYQVLLAKFGTVSLEEMNDQTTYLSTKAREFHGVYEGWQTKLMGTKPQFHLLYNPIADPTNTSK